MTDKKSSAPIPSGTIMLLRHDPEGMEVFMVVRHHQIDFASGALVFPGGKADPQDFDDNLLPWLQGQEEDQDLRAIQVSAIREAFEECGVLLAREKGSDQLVSAERVAKLDQYREPLNNGELKLLDFLEQEQLVLACDTLVHFAHWITPEGMPKRFDTHFYLALAPDDQIALHDGYESVDSVWIRPQDALDEAKAGTKTIIFPTLRNIERLATTQTPETSIAAAQATPVIPILPWMEKRDDGMYVCIPTDAGYAVCEEKVPGRP
jgi:8-oxo-dGTP pyrophosphatase MutT (NUDIX family)